MPTSITVSVRLGSGGDTTMSTIPLDFDPKAVFGKARVPVVVTINGYSYRSTTFNMKGERFVPLRRSHREAAGVEPGQRVKVKLELDEKPRTVKTPADLAKALKASGLSGAWKALSFSHQREHVEAIEGAKKPETRARRIEKCVEMVGARARGAK